LTDSQSTERLLNRKELLKAAGLSAKALTQFEKAGRISAVIVDGRPHYTLESAEHLKAMVLCQGRCANQAEAHEMALQATSLKKTRNEKASVSSEGDNVQQKWMDPKQIKTHPLFGEGLPRSKDLLAEITKDMALKGYRPSEPIALATWPGQEEPAVYDGHTRRLGAIAADISLVPVVIEYFDSMAAAMEEFVKSQILRRPNDQGVRFRLFECIDSPLERGGDRRSEQAKSKPPNGGIEKGRSPSAQRTADLVGWTVRMVERARRVRDQGTSEILEAVRNNKMSLSKAEKAIADQAKETSDTEPPVPQNEDGMVHLTDENLAGLKELGGNRHSHVNTAVEQYIVREFRKRASSEQQDSEVDDQKPGSSNDNGAAAE
jgi:hypothetical protein